MDLQENENLSDLMDGRRKVVGQYPAHGEVREAANKRKTMVFHVFINVHTHDSGI